jgi:hypothetical protein
MQMDLDSFIPLPFPFQFHPRIHGNPKAEISPAPLKAVAILLSS